MVQTVDESVSRQRAPTSQNRRLLTALFMDMVGSTQQAASLGDLAWRELLSAFYTQVELELRAFDGREIDRAGDGFFAVFDGPTRAIQCARSIQDRARPLQIELRA